MMSKKARVLIIVVIVEAALAGLWWYLARYGMANPDRVTADFQAVVGQTHGNGDGRPCWVSASSCSWSPPATTARLREKASELRRHCPPRSLTDQGPRHVAKCHSISGFICGISPSGRSAAWRMITGPSISGSASAATKALMRRAISSAGASSMVAAEDHRAAVAVDSAW